MLMKESPEHRPDLIQTEINLLVFVGGRELWVEESGVAGAWVLTCYGWEEDGDKGEEDVGTRHFGRRLCNADIGFF